MKIWQKSLAAPGVAIVFLALVGSIAYGVISTQQSVLRDLYQERFAGYRFATRTAQTVAEVHSNVYRLFTWIGNLDEKKIDEAIKAQNKRLDEAAGNVVEAARHPDVLDTERALLAAVGRGIAAYKVNIDNAIDLSSVDINTGMSAMQTADSSFAKLVEDLSKLVDLETKRAASSYEAAVSASGTAVVAILSLLGLALTISAVLAVFMSRLITRPLLQAVKVADAVAAGDLSKEIEISSNDETGHLLRSMQRMVETLNGFVGAQAEMARRHDAGEIDDLMADAEFPGVYGQMAASINALATAQVALTRNVVHVVGQYAQGDLSCDMEPLPGKKAQFTDAVNAVKQSLQSINQEIASLVDAAARGDFKVRGDTGKYQHDFRGMVEGLNKLMQVSEGGLTEVARVLGALAKGDLTQRITAEYQGTFGQLKDDANATGQKLAEIVSNIKDSIESIDVAAKEIASGNTDLSSRTEEQASSLEETASSMEELTATVKQNAENARQANQLAAGASDIAVKGGDVVGKVVSTMTSINESSKKIKDIIAVIDGIAFQTNILALNAAVEAARAGAQGRGFAVVATEVRTLAQRSAAAAKEIKELIGDSVEKVGAGTKLVDEAGSTMGEIVTAVKRVTDIMAEITAASQEQSSGIEQVNTAITQMDEVTQQNAALVEEAAAAAESLEEQAINLVQAVKIFRLREEASLSPASQVSRGERRGANRATNVKRLPSAIAPAKSASEPPKKAMGAGARGDGGQDEWEQF